MSQISQEVYSNLDCISNLWIFFSYKSIIFALTFNFKYNPVLIQNFRKLLFYKFVSSLTVAYCVEYWTVLQWHDKKIVREKCITKIIKNKESIFLSQIIYLSFKVSINVYDSWNYEYMIVTNLIESRIDGIISERKKDILYVAGHWQI